ncbi:hypothetical protein RKE29_16005 [Streptomyces sp. B1866]|uniref:hypothetical protein n=1 Tax=Streptomyces sp. B1866 TaxID=3075431 RepID=UPI0028925CF4|nr:hypothetical protein [Streptomyces sp. B1866]MDT3398127.1 hypothetical protein [Streptomyces sp. B1866]
MSIEGLLKEAAARGVTRLPQPSHLSHVRVWPAHGGQWVAEVGEPPHNITVGDGLYPSQDDARTTALAHISLERAKLMTLLPEELARQAASLPDPVVAQWDS